MNIDKANKIRSICELIKQDCENDIKESEGKEFNGKNVHELFGKQAAAINALANITIHIVEDLWLT